MIKTLLAENILIPFYREEDGTAYRVWKVTADGKTCVLKQAKGCEAEIYRTFFDGIEQTGSDCPVPKYFKSTQIPLTPAEFRRWQRHIWHLIRAMLI